MKEDLGFNTRAVHVGKRVDHRTGAVITPIYMTSTFDLDSEEGYLYTRLDNPTTRAAEERIASLEGAEGAIITSSGMGAVTASLLSQLQAGDHVVSIRELYGRSFAVMNSILPRMGIQVTMVDTVNLQEMEDAVTPETRVIFLESPTNPMLRLVDIERVVKLARGRGIKTIIDNTFATPYNQLPLTMGIDIVVHSATKYLNGHSDLVAGAVAGSREDVEKAKGIRSSVGTSIDPFGAYFLLRGLTTLGLRMERHNRNGLEVARFLEGHPRVERVHYPGLESHPQHDLAEKQMRGFSGMVTFQIKGGLSAAEKVARGLKLSPYAPSLGGVESLVSIPATTSHASMTPEERAEAGITDGTIRFSVGIEDSDDLIADLDRALSLV